jgi:uncharacterized protein YceH (UPF0502 family)
MDLDAAEVRVLGCLIEKQRTTPDAYPLTLNGLRAACNQTTNRDPVVAYDEELIRDALHRLGRRRWTRLASGAGSRAAKYRHLLDDALGLSAAEQAVLAVLMLRGPQTPGELKQRTERMQPFADLAAVEATLDGLITRELVARLPRRPGQKEERYAHRLSEDLEEPAAAVSPTTGAAPAATTAAASPMAGAGPAGTRVAASPMAGAAPSLSDDDRIQRLERRVEELAAELAELRTQLGG